MHGQYLEKRKLSYMAVNGNLAGKDMDHERICFLGFKYVISLTYPYKYMNDFFFSTEYRKYSNTLVDLRTF